ncbi:hypothetical protein CKJ75_03970 [Mycobacterium avium]|nr:hypothetical protein CKJ74_03450 [Mycobacterium avium]PBA07712.1 hypothetical protein CKJ73_03440 [Mycobacterium avium]PBA14449.1 hypothetical protein CKJ70_03520 [Mycobacterium avium]PBA77916.1 hypothetical protein CKJ75_03970 [Mycobacterium avium]
MATTEPHADTRPLLHHSTGRDHSPFRPSTHGEMYWQNRYYNLDVYRYSRGVAVLDAAAAMTKESL